MKRGFRRIWHIRDAPVRSGRTRRVTKYDSQGTSFASHIGHNPPVTTAPRPYTRVGAAIGRPRSVALVPHHPGRIRTLSWHHPVVAHDSQGTSCASHMRQPRSAIPGTSALWTGRRFWSLTSPAKGRCPSAHAGAEGLAAGRDAFTIERGHPTLPLHRPCGRSPSPWQGRFCPGPSFRPAPHPPAMRPLHFRDGPMCDAKLVPWESSAPTGASSSAPTGAHPARLCHMRRQPRFMAEGRFMAPRRRFIWPKAMLHRPRAQPCGRFTPHSLQASTGPASSTRMGWGASSRSNRPRYLTRVSIARCLS